MRLIPEILIAMLFLSSVGIAQKQPAIVPTTQPRTTEILSELDSINQQLGKFELDDQLIAKQKQLLLNLKQLFNRNSESGSDQPSQTTSRESNPSSGSSISSTPDSPNSDGSTIPATVSVPGQSRQPEINPLVKPELADAVWGHLPEQEQQELIRTFNEHYLPSYESQIKGYFEKLSKLDSKAD